MAMALQLRGMDAEGWLMQATRHPLQREARLPVRKSQVGIGRCVTRHPVPAGAFGVVVDVLRGTLFLLVPLAWWWFGVVWRGMVW